MVPDQSSLLHREHNSSILVQLFYIANITVLFSFSSSTSRREQFYSRSALLHREHNSSILVQLFYIANITVLFSFSFS
ncbi:hypothetical protein RRG08_034417 [Elysia crispata]|uniref:Uncharacterized protein n=1 Tax=Elysia crispata TaxID=231223 RepID=A0AAE0YE21_9GAST|nr:hypothetical protein RRG08_034417 [Elysia crispata]